MLDVGRGESVRVGTDWVALGLGLAVPVPRGESVVVEVAFREEDAQAVTLVVEKGESVSEASTEGVARALGSSLLETSGE